MIALNIKDIKVLNFTRRRKKSHPIGFNLSIGFQSKLSYPLLLIMLLLFNSCQKDFLTNVEPNIEAIARTGKSSISFAELQKKIRIAKSGTFNSMLSSTDEKDGKFQMTDEIVLLTDKVTMITTKGISTYTLAVQQKPGQRATFQNVIFVDRNGDIETYVLTYKASKWFAAKFKVDKKAGFEGYVSYSKLDKNVKKYKGGTNKVSAESCT